MDFEHGAVDGGKGLRVWHSTNRGAHQCRLSFSLAHGGAVGSTYRQSLAILPPPARRQFLDQADSTVSAADGGISRLASRTFSAVHAYSGVEDKWI